MKYSNWQELHKKAFSTQTNQPVEGSKNEKAANFFIEELHQSAWTRLQQLCSKQELNKLKHLAFLYSNGFKKHDTAFD